MLSIFNQATPLYNARQNLIRYFLVGCFIAFFLIVYQPFGTDRDQIPYKNLFLSGYGVITFVAFACSFILIPTIFKNQIREENWVVWKQILLTLFAMILTFAGCYFYLQFSFGRQSSFRGFFGFLKITLSIAIFPIIIVVLLDYIYQLKKNQAFAQNLNQQLVPASTNDKSTPIQQVVLKDENDKVDLTLHLDQLLFIKAANNYVEVNYLEGDKIKKHLLRNSIRNIEQQLTNPTIKRCHRSYLVNLDKVGRITGNAQGYKLHFPITADFVVPVSRSKGKELLAIFKE